MQLSYIDLITTMLFPKNQNIFKTLGKLIRKKSNNIIVFRKSGISFLHPTFPVSTLTISRKVEGGGLVIIAAVANKTTMFYSTKIKTMVKLIHLENLMALSNSHIDLCWTKKQLEWTGTTQSKMDEKQTTEKRFWWQDVVWW